MDELLSFTDSALTTDPNRSNLAIAREICAWSYSGAKDPLSSECKHYQVAAFLELVRKVRELGDLSPD